MKFKEFECNSKNSSAVQRIRVQLKDAEFGSNETEMFRSCIGVRFS